MAKHDAQSLPTPEVPSRPAYDALKRGADIVVSALGLLMSAPAWLLIGAAIVADDGWPILYSQPRTGLGGRVFRVLKFRSMRKDAESNTGAVFASKDDPRVTRIGRVLRKTALDEIPQIVNILKGDMSWVGPRPERPEFVQQFMVSLPDYPKRHQVRPGLTGMAQVYGRYYSEAAEKLEYDLEYLRRRSLWLDLKLFTVSWVVTFKGRWDAEEKR
jgi:lipopolysaccharide/colanic/teichoic acid biosynthesis glycosyltransferase